MDRETKTSMLILIHSLYVKLTMLETGSVALFCNTSVIFYCVLYKSLPVLQCMVWALLILYFGFVTESKFWNHWFSTKELYKLLLTRNAMTFESNLLWTTDVSLFFTHKKPFSWWYCWISFLSGLFWEGLWLPMISSNLKTKSSAFYCLQIISSKKQSN